MIIGHTQKLRPKTNRCTFPIITGVSDQLHTVTPGEWT